MNTSKHRVLITGVNGYIGSTLARILATHDDLVVHGLDNNSSINRPNVGIFYSMDVRYDGMYEFKNHYDTVVHLAALISVEESVQRPSLYFDNNVMGTMKTIDSIQAKNFIFASTSAAFDPKSPYALSKLISEDVIREKCDNYTIFRFFNVAGSDGVNKQIGNSTHLIRVAAEAAAGKRPSMVLNGTDWNTRDGTCIRDYIHVVDLANAIVKAIYEPKNTEYECLATGKNYTCKEVIDTMKTVTGVDFDVINGPRRLGDAEILSIDYENISSYMDQKYSLEDMCMSSYRAELSR